MANVAASLDMLPPVRRNGETGVNTRSGSRWRLIGAVLLCLIGLQGARAAEPAGSRAGELVLGRVSDNPKLDYAKLKALLDYVVPRMHAVGIERGRILMARDRQQMASYLRRGQVDWITETIGAALGFEDRAGARIVLLSERDGLASYQSVFFARSDRNIGALADLRGKTLAFQSPASTSSYFLPVSELLAEQLVPTILANYADPPGAGDVGFVFAGSELNVSTWVHKGLVDAGAYSETDWNDPLKLPEAMRRDLMVFHRTGFVPRAAELTSASMSDAVREHLISVLLGAANDPPAQTALRRYWRTTAFRAPDASARRALDDLRRGVRRIHAEVE
jgi:phosphonate transport system substrate-binding protein